MRLLRTHVPRPLHAVPLLALLLLAVTAWPAAGGHDPRPWPHGRVTYYDASGSSEAVAAAARRWNLSGARVQLSLARTRASADVVFVADRRRTARALRPALPRPLVGDRAPAGRARDRAARP